LREINLLDLFVFVNESFEGIKDVIILKGNTIEYYLPKRETLDNAFENYFQISRLKHFHINQRQRLYLSLLNQVILKHNQGFSVNFAIFKA
jgi:hypothetical protein